MKNLALVITLFFYLFSSDPGFAQTGQYNTTYIQGNFCSQAQGGAPIPGLLVSLVHPQLGRSAPVYTDNFGNFSMGNIPISNIPYYLEVYWGRNLIYRTSFPVYGPMRLPRTCI